MSSSDFVYGKARKAIDQAQINLITSAVSAMLVTSGYASQPAIDQWVSDIPGDSIVVRDIALTGLGLTSSGVFFGTIPPLNALSSALTAAAIVLYVKGASDDVSPLLYYSSSGPGFPFQPQGFNYVIGFDQSNGGFFQ